MCPGRGVGGLGAARQAEAQRVEVVGQGFAALGARMHGQTRGLVDHEHQSVTIEEPRQELGLGHGGDPLRDGSFIDARDPISFEIMGPPLSRPYP
jgi:hypothetical protein